MIQTVNGIVTGMILALVASGLTLIFGIMDVVNFAHGELFMLGAYVGVIVMVGTGSFWLALLVATLTVALLGAALQIVTLRPLIGRDPLNTILVTFGISLILQNYALWQFGPTSRKISEPITSHFILFYLEYPWYRILIAALSAAIIGGCWLFLKYSKCGVWIRATTQDRIMAQAMGIPVPQLEFFSENSLTYGGFRRGGRDGTPPDKMRINLHSRAADCINAIRRRNAHHKRKRGTAFDL